MVLQIQDKLFQGLFPQFPCDVIPTVLAQYAIA